MKAAQVADMIQSYRGTAEDKLPWVKDVMWGEDAFLIHAANPATLMAMLWSWVDHCIVEN